MNREDLKILELNRQLNSLKAFVMSELKSAEMYISDLEELVLTIARQSKIPTSRIAKEIKNHEANKKFKSLLTQKYHD